MLCCGGRFAFAASGQDDPCPPASKIEERECFSREQLRINKEVDALAIKITATLRTQANDADKNSQPNVSSALRKAALELTNSQATWKTYRDHYCRAVMYSFTNGSGSRASYDTCLFDLATSHLKDLRGYFGDGE